jgi:GxxExxY protein
MPLTNAGRRDETRDFLHADLTALIIGAFYWVFDGLGFGFLESVDKNSLAKVLKSRGLAFERELPVEVWFEGEMVGRFKADFIVEGKVLLEVKASQAIVDSDRKQLMNYLRGSSIEVGLLLHFGPKAAFERIVYSNSNKTRER